MRDVARQLEELWNVEIGGGLARQEARVTRQAVLRIVDLPLEERERVGARMPTPNPDFDESLHRRLYVEQDPSKLIPLATAAATEPAPGLIE